MLKGKASLKMLSLVLVMCTIMVWHRSKRNTNCCDSCPKQSYKYWHAALMAKEKAKETTLLFVRL